MATHVQQQGLNVNGMKDKAFQKDVCIACNTTVYPLERMAIDGNQVIHKACFKCTHCNGSLTLSNFAAINGKYYCKPHYMAIFKESGGKYGAFANNNNNNSSSSSSSSTQGKAILSTPVKPVTQTQPSTTGETGKLSLIQQRKAMLLGGSNTNTPTTTRGRADSDVENVRANEAPVMLNKASVEVPPQKTSTTTPATTKAKNALSSFISMVEGMTTTTTSPTKAPEPVIAQKKDEVVVAAIEKPKVAMEAPPVPVIQQAPVAPVIEKPQTTKPNEEKPLKTSGSLQFLLEKDQVAKSPSHLKQAIKSEQNHNKREDAVSLTVSALRDIENVLRYDIPRIKKSVLKCLDQVTLTESQENEINEMLDEPSTARSVMEDTEVVYALSRIAVRNLQEALEFTKDITTTIESLRIAADSRR